jgi:hypothetical protein
MLSSALRLCCCLPPVLCLLSYLSKPLTLDALSAAVRTAWQRVSQREPA